MAGNHNLTTEGEIRYIIQWFNEWSELQRQDFLPFFMEYYRTAANPSPSSSNTVYVNGIVSGLANATCTDKPMSLFQCRVKLFREWSPKWPETTKDTLKEKICEIDEDFSAKFQSELTALENGNGHQEELNGDEEVPEPVPQAAPILTNGGGEEIALNA